jgi:hypothetical protein
MMTLTPNDLTGSRTVVRCHKTTFHPDKHIGPFEQPYGKPCVYQDNGETFEALQCEACGNTVIRMVQKTGDLVVS